MSEMTEEDARKVIAEAFAAAQVVGSKHQFSPKEIIEMQDDILLEEYEIDSLAIMEICISIEVNTGIIITPAEMSGISSVNSLVSMVMGRGCV